MESSVGRLTKTVGQPETGCEPTWILAANKEPFTKKNNFWFLTSGGIKKTKPLRRSESSDTNFGFFHLKKVYCISNSYRKLAKMKVRKIFLLGL